MREYFRLKDTVPVEDLQKYGFKVFKSIFKNNTTIATRDITKGRVKAWEFFRISCSEDNRVFQKSKYRGLGKCSLCLKCTREDIHDLIKAGIVERVKEL